MCCLLAHAGPWLRPPETLQVLQQWPGRPFHVEHLLHDPHTTLALAPAPPAADWAWGWTGAGTTAGAAAGAAAGAGARTAAGAGAGTAAGAGAGTAAGAGAGASVRPLQEIMKTSFGTVYVSPDPSVL